ncbi:aminodeoxychorismate synthase component I [Anseongella ginsenosidimutans]|nr:aminodeoxychorismate synthase component I [Anseongella ginsenosidimutans]
MNAAEEFSIDDPEQFKLKAFYRASRQEHVCCLDSGGYHEGHSSFDWLIGSGARSSLQPVENCFGALETFIKEVPGWKLGFLGYDLKNEVERLSSENSDPLGFPPLYFFVPRELIMLKGNSVRISSESSPSGVFREILDTPLPEAGAPPPPPRIRQRVSRAGYLETVAAIRRHIVEGDVYELNYCLDFYAENYECDPARLFLRLNETAPAPFASFLKLGKQFILCASPERFLKKTGSRIISQPIKGTIRRSEHPGEDQALKKALRNSEKEQAENVMIVDLVRNDLSRSAVPGTVRVSELFGIHTFRHWHQMISTVEAEAKPGLSAADIIRHAFPMGSMTGAPKIMAMKLIDKFEEVKRGAFSGAIGYFSPEGDFDFNVVIRSILYNSQTGYLSFPVGSAITYDSVAENEYEECLLKAKAIRNLFNSAR